MRGANLGWTALPLILGLAGPALAQTPPASAPSPATPVQIVPSEENVAFSADVVTYDTDNEIVTATGRVRMSRDGNYVAADQVNWNRKSGEVIATGNVVVVNPQGDKLVGERVVLSDELRDGSIQNLLVVLETGGRLASESGARNNNVTTLEKATYSPCPVTTAATPTRAGAELSSTMTRPPARGVTSRS